MHSRQEGSNIVPHSQKQQLHSHKLHRLHKQYAMTCLAEEHSLEQGCHAHRPEPGTEQELPDRGGGGGVTCTALVGSLMVAGRVMRERSLPMAFLSTLQMEKPRCKGLGAGNLVLEFAALQLSLLMLCNPQQVMHQASPNMLQLLGAGWHQYLNGDLF